MSFCIGFLCGVICCVLLDVRQAYLKKNETEAIKQVDIITDEVKQKENEEKARQFEKLMSYEPYSIRKNRGKLGGK